MTLQCCAQGGLVIDVGANLGYYALYSARLGCKVTAWEPVPVFAAMVEASAALNNLSLTLRRAVLGDGATKTARVRVPRRSAW